MTKRYEIECFGDIRDKQVFESLKDALVYLKKTYGYTDPEDNRMIVKELLESGHSKVVWHFSGWHWDSQEFDLPQGKYIGDKESVYEISCRD